MVNGQDALHRHRHLAGAVSSWVSRASRFRLAAQRRVRRRRRKGSQYLITVTPDNLVTILGRTAKWVKAR